MQRMIMLYDGVQKNGHLEVVKYLISVGANIHAYDDSQIVKVCPDYVKFKNMCNNSINSTYFNSKRIQFIKITSETFLTCVCREQNCIHGYKSQRYNEKATKIIKALTTDNDPTQNIWITGDCVFTLSAGFMTAQHFESTTIGLKYETSESNVSYIFGSNIYA